MLAPRTVEAAGIRLAKCVDEESPYRFVSGQSFPGEVLNEG